MNLISTSGVLIITGLTDVSDVLRTIATVGGALLALVWFLATRAYKRHTEVELSCRAFAVPDGTLAEIAVVIENKGARRSKLTHLAIGVARLKAGAGMNDYLIEAEWEPIGKDTIITIEPERRLVVLQGISQEFTHTFIVRRDIDLIQVTASFNPLPKTERVLSLPYPSKRTARRVFDLRNGCKR